MAGYTAVAHTGWLSTLQPPALYVRHLSSDSKASTSGYTVRAQGVRTA